MFAKKKAARTCEKGHPLEPSWERCPYCEAERESPAEDPAAPAAAVEEAPGAPASPEPDVPDPARRPVVVPRPAEAVGLPGGWLVALSGEQAGEDFRLEHGRNVLGKGSECGVTIKDAHASERHAVLEIRKAGDIVLEDLGSRHGTFVNGQAVSGRRALRDGDRVRLGGTELVFRVFDRS